jgi:hypothetical protein
VHIFEEGRKGMTATRKRECCECRDGEHETLSDDVRLYVVREPSTGRMIRRGYLCAEHVSTNLDDGYTVEEA